MKKIIWILLLLCAITVFSFNTILDDTEIDTPVNSMLTENEKTEDEYSFDYIDIHFTHSPSNTINVTINYPQFKDEKLANLNKKIEEFAKLKFKNIIVGIDETSTLSLDETYNVKLANKSIVSIASTGNIFVAGAAYPSLTNTTYNIHPITLKEYSTDNILDISDEFTTLFKTSITGDENLVSYISAFSLEELKDELLNSKVSVTDNELVILFNVPHALGEFIEIKFSQETISKYIKL